MRKTFARTLAAAWTFAAGLAFAPACGSTPASICASKGHCPADMPRSQWMVSDCNTLLGDATCGAKYQAALQCLSDNEQCDSAGNADATATLQACAAPYATWMACASPPDAATGN